MKRLAAILVLTTVALSSSSPNVEAMCEDIPESITEQEATSEEVATILETSDIEEEGTVDEIEIAINEMNKKMAEVNSITDTKEWFIAYKKVVDEYSDIIDPPETIYDYYSDDELDLLFRVVQAEIGNGTFGQKCNVASAVLNRIEHKRFPNTINGVLISSQFETIANGRYKKVEVSEDTILACEYAFEIADTTDGALFFDSNKALGYKFLFNDGAHNFYCLR
jgi:hypothetical protein